MKVLIKNGQVIDSKNKRNEKLDILLVDGKISKISKSISVNSDYEIDAKGMIVSPGFVDLHANFCDPGATNREDLKSGSIAAAKGGYTHVVLGVDNKPAPSESNVIDYINKYKEIMPTNLYPSAAVTIDRNGEDAADISFLYNHGAMAFYDGLKPINNKDILVKVLEALKRIKKPLSIYSEITKDIRERGISKAGAKKISYKYYTEDDAEVTDLKENLEITKAMSVPIDLAYVSDPKSLEEIEKAKSEGQIIYTEVTAMNLFFNDQAMKKCGVNAKVLPPLRSESDRKKLVKSLKGDLIDAISSNHVPLEEDDKDESLKFKDVVSGTTMIEFVLGILGSLVDDGEIKWEDILPKLTIGPAKVFSLDKDGAGSLEIGDVANIVIFNPKEKWKVKIENIVSKSKNTPLIGTELVGKVKYTICNGKLIYRDKE